MVILFAQYCRKLDQNLLKLGFGVLFYELHAHYGVALAHIGDHRKAVREFTFAIEAVSAPKVRGGGCLLFGRIWEYNSLLVWLMLMFGAENSVADWQHE